MPDSSNKVLRITAVTIVSAIALAASAAAGAWVQASLNDKPAPGNEHELQLVEQASRNGAYVRQNLDLLARKVGDLQARVIAIDSLGQRIAQAAGVDSSAPELQASLDQTTPQIMDDLGSDDAAMLWSAEGLGRQLDMLTREVADKQDQLAMLEALLSQRAGLQASLPTQQPVNYPYLSSSFGWRQHPVTGRHTMHEGLDFAAPRGSPIYAASGGVVTEARYVPGYGKLVQIDHGNGLVTRYAHASSITVKLGAVVEKGQMVARVGSTGRSTGPHLHFEVRLGDQPLDPRLFLDGDGDPEKLLATASETLNADGAQVR